MNRKKRHGMNRFIAHFEYLGFKEFIENNDLEDQNRIVSNNLYHKSVTDIRVQQKIDNTIQFLKSYYPKEH
jgi:hypothetical protein